MCGRYFYSREGLMRILENIRSGDAAAVPGGSAGEIRPGDSSLIITGNGSSLRAEEAAWGFPSKGGGLIINARSETALMKPMFSESALSRRCLIPAERFWEWDASKEKYAFEDPAGRIMLLAGFWRRFEGLARFVVLTAAANASVSSVHERMPVIVPEDSAIAWLSDAGSYAELTGAEMPLLNARRDEDQLRLF
ncbi:MAG: SOS response-associated peptidase family protein [Firmicutes bacterium]|nr:SOS response-associated peptidase family protein [Bacillota bacterium]